MGSASKTVRLASFDRRLVEVRPDNVVAAVRRANELRAARKIDGVNVRGFVSKSFEPLGELAPMRRIQLQSCEKVDISPLYARQKALHRLVVTSTPVAVDFGKLGGLRQFSGFWHPESSGLDALPHLETLSLWKLDDRYADVESLGLSSTVRALWFTQSKIRSLRGVGRLKRLSEIELAYLPGKIDLSPVSGAGKLTRIKLENVPRHQHIEALGRCKSLKDVHIEKCGTVDTIAWVRKLKSLDAFACIGTKVADGDFSAIRELPKLRFFSADNRREYEPPIRELEAMVDARGAA